MAQLVRLKRTVYLLHRWMGVGGCVLMLLWLISGVVMLFVGYPKLLPQERLVALPTLDAAARCLPPERALVHSAAPEAVRQIQLTSVAGRPRYMLREGDGRLVAVDALSGQRIGRIDASQALASAQAFKPGTIPAAIDSLLDEDRWTHSGALDAHRPLYRVQMGDAESTVLYVSSATGQVVMDAPLAQRAWNAIGAWLHWLYMFREGSRDPVWSWTVIVLSALGTVLALTGLLAGLWRWRFSGRYKSGARTPYRGLGLRWHHTLGMLFGVMLLGWIFSGLMSMNPLGIFDPAGPRPDQAAYRQGQPGELRLAGSPAQVLASLQAQGFEARELEWRVLNGQPFVLARNGTGTTRVVMADTTHGDDRLVVLDQWPQATLREAASRLLPAGIVSAELLPSHDAFYYQRGTSSMYAADARRLPALRLQFDDPGRTRVYLDVYTGDVALSVDRSQRLGRWLFNLLHSWDLPLFLKAPIAREAILTLLSLGASLIAITGCVIGCQRLRAHLRGRRHLSSS